MDKIKLIKEIKMRNLNFITPQKSGVIKGE